MSAVSKLLTLDPAQRIPGTPTADRIGFLGLVLFGISAWSSPILNHCAFALLAVASLMAKDAREAITHHPISRLLLVFGAYILLEMARGIAEAPQLWALQLLEAAKWLLLAGFPVVAVWIRGETGRINLLLGLTFLGLMLGMLSHGDWRMIARFDTSIHAQFQFTRGGIPGLASTASILALLLFVPRLVGSRQNQWFIGRLFVWFLAVYLSLYMLVACQSRISWLALGLVGLPLLIYRAWQLYRGSHTQLARGLTASILLVAGIGVAGLLMNAEVIAERTAGDRIVIDALLEGRTDALPPSSFGYRYQMLRFGMEKFLERPWLGWGTLPTNFLTRRQGDPRLLIPDLDGVTPVWIGNLHNTYLEIALHFGIFGLLLFAVGAVLLLREIRAAHTKAQLPQDYFLFMLGLLGILLVWSTSGHRATREEWRVYWFILAGIAYTFSFQRPCGRQNIAS